MVRQVQTPTPVTDDFLIRNNMKYKIVKENNYYVVKEKWCFFFWRTIQDYSHHIPYNFDMTFSTYMKAADWIEKCSGGGDFLMKM